MFINLVRHLSLPLLFCLFSLPHLAQTSTPAPTPTPYVLEINLPVQKEIKPGQTHIFALALEQNQFIKVELEQKGVDVGGRLNDLDGAQLMQVDVIKTLTGVEVLEFVAAKSGNYLFVITNRDLRKDGNYEIRIVERRGATEKEKSVDEARRMITQGNALGGQRKCDQGVEVMGKSISILERELGVNDTLVGKALLTLGNLQYCLGDYTKAEPIYLRSLQIYRDAFGADDNQLTYIMQQLGSNYRMLGNYLKAEETYRKMLEIREKQLDPKHGFIADTLTSVGNLLLDRGDTAKSAEYLKRALEIREYIFGTEHQFVAESLVNLANTSGDLKFSEPLLLRALAIREKLFGKESVQVGRVCSSLASLYVKNSEFEKAETFGKRSFAVLEKTAGATHPMTAYALNTLGIVYAKQGRYSEAEAVYRKTIEIREKSNGPFHPDLGGTFANLADIYALKGDIAQAISNHSKAMEIVELNVASNLGTGSEREKIAYLSSVNPSLQDVLTLHFKYGSDSNQAREMAATVLLRQKGRVLDVVSDQMAVLQNNLAPNDLALLDSLRQKNKEISELIVSIGKLGETEYKAKLKTLIDERERLEGEISRKAVAYGPSSKPVTLPDVIASIPPNAALLEFGVHRPTPLDDTHSVRSRSAVLPRYVVFVIRRDGQIASMDLGGVAEIDKMISAFRLALQDPKSASTNQFGRSLEEKLIAPVKSFLGDSTRLLISPDGELNLIPFEALIGKSGKYLLEEYSISYLSSGRDLLRMRSQKEGLSSPLILANPDFGASPASSVMVDKNQKRRNANVAKTLAETYFAPLSGTEQEGQRIKTLFPESRLLTGLQANESVLKQVRSPKILHLATHGFFINSGDPEEENQNPLIRTGLALSGANRQTSNDNDGILTALEGTGLSLFGTRLVVLSACGTGLGEVQTGEGVFGLRRSFVLAGSESLVISLWSVSDYITRELMVGYYKNLKQGVGRGESLRNIQLEMIKNPKRKHPFYWASFIQSGDWRPLNVAK